MWSTVNRRPSCPRKTIPSSSVCPKDNLPVTRCPFTPAYAPTIIKAQGQNIRYLIIWLDSVLVPPGTAYLGLSRVRRKSAISLLQPIYADQLTPVQLSTGHHIQQSPTIVSVQPKRRQNFVPSSRLELRVALAAEYSHLRNGKHVIR